jgi:hypothetical protein
LSLIYSSQDKSHGFNEFDRLGLSLEANVGAAQSEHINQLSRAIDYANRREGAAEEHEVTQARLEAEARYDSKSHNEWYRSACRHLTEHAETRS